jgi:hypothetical protein
MTDPEITSLRREIDALSRSTAALAGSLDRDRTAKVRSTVTSSLATKHKLDATAAQRATDYLVDVARVVRLDGERGVYTDADGEHDLEAGLARWLASDDGEPYRPATEPAPSAPANPSLADLLRGQL